MLQTLFRRFLATKERMKRARIVEVALGAGLRTLGQAVGELEVKVSGLPEAVQQVCFVVAGTGVLGLGLSPQPIIPLVPCVTSLGNVQDVDFSVNWSTVGASRREERAAPTPIGSATSQLPRNLNCLHHRYYPPPPSTDTRVPLPFRFDMLGRVCFVPEGLP